MTHDPIRRHTLLQPKHGALTASPASILSLAMSVMLSIAAPSAWSQTPIPYKVIGADGKVTYTDRPSASDSRVIPLVASGAAGVATSAAVLPVELRQAADRYPVTLYVGDADCEPCSAARQLLRRRGIPFSERQVLTVEDSVALERLSGGRDAPTLAIGAQLLRGLAPEVWSSYLDAAGYPRDSRLPASYQYPAATPLVVRAAAPTAAIAPPTAQNDAPTVPNLPNASSFRF